MLSLSSIKHTTSYRMYAAYVAGSQLELGSNSAR